MTEKRDWLVTVCDMCKRASCWHGEFMCSHSPGAGTEELLASELDKLGKENPERYSVDKLTRIQGHPPKRVGGVVKVTARVSTAGHILELAKDEVNMVGDVYAFLEEQGHHLAEVEVQRRGDTVVKFLACSKMARDSLEGFPGVTFAGAPREFWATKGSGPIYTTTPTDWSAVSVDAVGLLAGALELQISVPKPHGVVQPLQKSHGEDSALDPPCQWCDGWDCDCASYPDVSG